MKLNSEQIKFGYSVKEILIREKAEEKNFTVIKFSNGYSLKKICKSPVMWNFLNIENSNWAIFSLYYLYKDNEEVCHFKLKQTDGCCGSGTLFDFSFNRRLYTTLDFKNTELFKTIIQDCIDNINVTQILATNDIYNENFDKFLIALGFNKLGDTFYNPNSSNYVQNWIYLDEYRNNEENYEDDDDEDNW